MLQAPDFDMLQAMALVHSTLKNLVAVRTDGAFEDVIGAAKTFVEELTENIELRPLPRGRDDDERSALTRFRSDIYYYSIDTIITQLQERFCGEGSHAKNGDASGETFDLVKDIGLFSRKNIQLIKENNDALPANAFEGFAKVYPKHMNPATATAEFVQFASHYSAFEQTLVRSDNNEQNISSIGSVFKVFCMSGLSSVFSQLYLLLHIALTLPVTSVSTKRSFSKPKLKKTRLRMRSPNPN